MGVFNYLLRMQETAPDQYYPIIGIDIGQSTINGYVFGDNNFQVVSKDIPGKRIPGIIRFDDKITFGDDANNGITDSSLVLKNLKNLIGVKNIPEVVMNNLHGCSVVLDEQGIPKIKFDNNVVDINGEATIYPEFAFALLLQHIVVQGSRMVGCKITDAVIAVPSTYTLKQIHVVKKCASYIGLNVLRFIVGPQAFVAYAVMNNQGMKGNINVCDLGGDQFVYSSVQVDNDGIKLVETYVDPDYSGYEIDNTFESHIRNGINEVTAPYRVDAEEIKIMLSEQNEVPLIVEGMQYNIITEYFDMYFEPVWSEVINNIEKWLNQAKYRAPNTQQIFITGGNVNIPSLRNALAFKQFTVYQQPEQFIALDCALIAIDMVKNQDNFNRIPIKNCILHNIYYSFNQRGGYHLFKAFTPLSDCKKIINHIPSFLSSSNRIFICDSADSWLGYFEVPVQDIHCEDYGCYFYMNDDFEMFMDVVTPDRRVITSCPFYYYDELNEEDIEHFKLVNELSETIRRIIAEFSKPQYEGWALVPQLIEIMDATAQRVSSLLLYPQDDYETITLQIKEYENNYQEYYKNSYYECLLNKQENV